MLQIEKIKIEHFRGIRELELTLGKENFGICGKNGTGKSGVVDAIEFGLTGNLSRLSGQGTSELSVTKHAPHVDERDDPEKAVVTLTVYTPSLKKSAVLHRSVKTAGTYTLSPDSEEMRKVIEEVQTHPEFALSRREIIKYIITPPNKRSTDVQILLRLSEVEEARKALQTISKNASKERDASEQSLKTARAELAQAFGLPLAELTPAAILKKVNEHRAQLSLAPLEELTSDTSLKEGIVLEEKPEAQKHRIVRSVALADIIALLGFSETESVKNQREAALEILKDLETHEDKIRTFRQQSLTRSGVDLLDGDQCPLCDIEWKHSDLRAHLDAKLESAMSVTETLQQYRGYVNGVAAEMRRLIGLLNKAQAARDSLCKEPSPLHFKAVGEELERRIGLLSNFSAEPTDIREVIAAASDDWWGLPADVSGETKEAEGLIRALPEASIEDQAIAFLTVVEERYRRTVDLKKTFIAAKSKAETAEKIFEIYEAEREKTLGDLYTEVSADFDRYYQFLNEEDEAGFSSELKPSAAKLGFNVDFYGRGRFPPGAYHSEGHQDGMGLCLYLALMKQTLGDRFTLAVLDDVLMSVDTGHRKKVCRLLKQEFPNTQFVLTTHDPVWLNFMKTESLVSRSQIFGGWHVDTGPRVWKDTDVWTDVEAALDQENVRQAAWHLRHYLEYVSTVLADSLRAKVEYKGDGRYSLEDLLPPTIERWKKKVSDALKAAKKREATTEIEALEELQSKVTEAYTATKAERWSVNPLVHYNDWANHTASEFRDVANAFKALLDTLLCNDCDTFVEMTPKVGETKVIRCSCGSLIFNL